MLLGLRDPHQCGPFWRDEPFVAIRNVEIRSDGGHVQRDIAQSMRAVNDYERTVSVGEGGQPLDGEYDGRDGGDVAHAEQLDGALVREDDAAAEGAFLLTDQREDVWRR